ncbi:hypothetical protein GCK72_008162 [Caenorhabditis remanei]|nr:hypothetical protein GCK72_008162 [Caenorhabditis remanei]KAF1759917.1 hypothetical protein GCK72_008162 [Caenorhabditis remanei]
MARNRYFCIAVAAQPARSEVGVQSDIMGQSKTDRYIMTVLPRVTEVDQFNDRVIALMGTELSAIENVSGSSVFVKACTWQRKEYSLIHSNLPLIGSSSDRLDMDSTAGGPCSELKFTVNCRVLLRRAIDQVKGLVNGLTGVLEEIDVVTGQVQKLGVSNVH